MALLDFLETELTFAEFQRLLPGSHMRACRGSPGGGGGLRVMCWLCRDRIGIVKGRM